MNKQNQLAEIDHSGKPYIIYKSKNGFNLFTNFSKKIILNKNNIKNFLRKKYKNNTKSTDLFIGFFGYEILNNLINIKIPRQKNINFPKGIFYKPEKIINLSNNLKYKSIKDVRNSDFKINKKKNYNKKIFNKFKKKIKSGETYQIKICTKYKTKSKINDLDFFSRLCKTNLDGTNFVDLRITNENNDEFVYRLYAGQSFVLHSHVGSMNATENAAAGLPNGDIVSVEAQANTAACSVEVFVASE